MWSSSSPASLVAEGNLKCWWELYKEQSSNSSVCRLRFWLPPQCQEKKPNRLSQRRSRVLFLSLAGLRAHAWSAQTVRRNRRGSENRQPTCVLGTAPLCSSCSNKPTNANQLFVNVEDMPISEVRVASSGEGSAGSGREDLPLRTGPTEIDNMVNNRSSAFPM